MFCSISNQVLWWLPHFHSIRVTLTSNKSCNSHQSQENNPAAHSFDEICSGHLELTCFGSRLLNLPLRKNCLPAEVTLAMGIRIQSILSILSSPSVAALRLQLHSETPVYLLKMRSDPQACETFTDRFSRSFGLVPGLKDTCDVFRLLPQFHYSISTLLHSQLQAIKVIIPHIHIDNKSHFPTKISNDGLI